MAWVKIDDGYARHTKLLAAGAEAMALDVAGMCFVAERDTDGFIPDAYLSVVYPPLRNAKKWAERLCVVDRWERDDDRGGYWVHDYLLFNPSSSEREEQSKRATAAAHARWNAKGNAKRMQPALRDASEAQCDGNAPRAGPVPSRIPPGSNSSSSPLGDDEPLEEEEAAIRREAERRMRDRKPGLEPIKDRGKWLERTMASVRQEHADERFARLASAAQWGVTLARMDLRGEELCERIKREYGDDREARLVVIRSTRKARRAVEEVA
jgi:hypothetical protein